MITTADRLIFHYAWKVENVEEMYDTMLRPHYHPIKVKTLFDPDGRKVVTVRRDKSWIDVLLELDLVAKSIVNVTVL